MPFPQRSSSWKNKANDIVTPAWAQRRTSTQCFLPEIDTPLSSISKSTCLPPLNPISFLSTSTEKLNKDMERFVSSTTNRRFSTGIFLTELSSGHTQENAHSIAIENEATCVSLGSLIKSQQHVNKNNLSMNESASGSHIAEMNDGSKLSSPRGGIRRRLSLPTVPHCVHPLCSKTTDNTTNSAFPNNFSSSMPAPAATTHSFAPAYVSRNLLLDDEDEEYLDNFLAQKKSEAEYKQHNKLLLSAKDEPRRDLPSFMYPKTLPYWVEYNINFVKRLHDERKLVRGVRLRKIKKHRLQVLQNRNYIEEDLVNRTLRETERKEVLSQKVLLAHRDPEHCKHVSSWATVLEIVNWIIAVRRAHMKILIVKRLTFKKMQAEKLICQWMLTQRANKIQRQVSKAFKYRDRAKAAIVSFIRTRHKNFLNRGVNFIKHFFTSMVMFLTFRSAIIKIRRKIMFLQSVMRRWIQCRVSRFTLIELHFLAMEKNVLLQHEQSFLHDSRLLIEAKAQAVAIMKKHKENVRQGTAELNVPYSKLYGKLQSNLLSNLRTKTMRLLSVAELEAVPLQQPTAILQLANTNAHKAPPEQLHEALLRLGIFQKLEATPDEARHATLVEAVNTHHKNFVMAWKQWRKNHRLQAVNVCPRLEPFLSPATMRSLLQTSLYAVNPHLLFSTDSLFC